MAQEKEFYMEDLAVGQKFTSGPVDVTAEEVMDFARKYDPQEFHLSPEQAKLTMFGELVASGWHTACLTMRLIIEGSPRMKGGMVGRSIEKMSWLRPVKPGDKLYFEGEILELRPSASNPARGVMRVKNTTLNQNREPVLQMESVVFVPSRPK
jgi:acyl dehydratase